MKCFRTGKVYTSSFKIVFIVEILSYLLLEEGETRGRASKGEEGRGGGD